MPAHEHDPKTAKSASKLLPKRSHQMEASEMPGFQISCCASTHSSRKS
jgi:hypothetical protein